MSKVMSLAGIRIGWIASNSRDLVESIAAVRDYTTISVSQLDDAVAAFVLEPSTWAKLLQRNLDLAKANLAALQSFCRRTLMGL